MKFQKSFIYEILAAAEVTAILFLVVNVQTSFFLKILLLILGMIGYSYIIKELKIKTIYEFRKERGDYDE